MYQYLERHRLPVNRLIYRLGLSKQVYKTRFEVPEWREETFIRDFSAYDFSAFFVMCDALAHFYAGVPDEEHARRFVAHLGDLDQNFRKRSAQVIADSPRSKLRDRIIEELIRSDDAAIRRTAFAMYLKQASLRLPAGLHRRLAADPGHAVRAMFVEWIGNRGDPSDISNTRTATAESAIMWYGIVFILMLLMRDVSVLSLTL